MRSITPTEYTTASPLDIAYMALMEQPDTLHSLESIIRHPRSLARPTPTWRPPMKRLPGILGSSEVCVTITRHRVGPRARAHMRGFGIEGQPAYLLTFRFTSPHGGYVDPDLAEGWVRAVAGMDQAHCVHEIGEETAPTFVWMVDSDYRALPSPAALFRSASEAA